MGKPVVLVIRDGWGDNPGGEATAKKDGNAPLLAETPFHEELFARYPLSRLSASGEDVGLPDGQMGNSEVGHLNLGAGRIVYQDLTRINKAIEYGDFRGERGAAGGVCEGQGRAASPFYRAAVGRRGAQSPGSFDGAGGRGARSGVRGHLRACDHGRARHVADERGG